ncbi:AAA family ATPase [Paenibacillus sp. GM2]|uniref:AAA family ATPase n=1 Tax=Paenibacillus sp. GM2 TaxID=1622070 RepID=UPI0008387901|nr:AAA family ATPase [Paenibacillus sp. GM2]
MYSEAAVYPFCAVVGQERAKKALLLHAANPLLKGVLLAGESGTSKTTLIRGLAALLQERRRINIPLHVDNERLFGGVDTAAALRYGIRKILPGLLAGADGQIVMVDDLNLMSERTLHAILAVVEQAGYEYERKDGEEACWQSSSFMLLGTMNPEEAGLKPGQLDRLGLYVRVETSLDPVERAEITRRRLAFERNPNDFARSFEPASAALQEQLVQTRRRLSSVSIAKPMLRKGSGLIPAMIVITDGKANAGMAPGLDLWPEIRRIGHRISAGGIQTLVIDTEQGFVRLGYASKLADCLQAQYFRLDELDAGRIERAVRNLVQEQNRAVPGLF